MSRAALQSVIRQIHRLADSSDAGQLTDRQLLERFARDRDESAFALLVRRHGPLVLGVGGRILHDTHDAEDVFQATFLVLVRKAGSLGWQASIRNWLYQVAYRLAMKAKAAAARRHVQERNALATPRQAETTDAAWRELCSLLDEELQRLPAKFREPLLLCYLEGRTTDEAAKELGWSLRTLKRRLEQGRERLRLRLTRRGLTLSLAMLSAGLTPQASAVPAVLTATTVKAAVEFATSTGMGAVSTNVLGLAGSLLKSLAVSRAKILAVCLLLVGLASGGTGIALYLALKADAADADQVAGEEAAGLVVLEEPSAPQDGKPARTDLFGDPLPPGALARMGTLQWRHHHSGGLAAAFSPDGKRVATSGDGPLRLWNAATGKLIWQLRGSQGYGAVHFSPNGKWLAAGGGTLLDVDTGRVFQQLSPRSYVLGFSPDSSLIATLDRGASISIVATASGQEVQHLPGHTGDITNDGVFTADGRMLVTLNHRNQLRHWDVATGVLRNTIELKLPQRRTSRFSQDARSLAVVPYSLKPVVVIDVETGKERCKLQGKPACARYGLAFTPDGKTLATDWIEDNSREALISLWDVSTGTFLRRFTVPSRCAGHLLFSPDGRTLLLAGGDSRINLWDTITGQPLPGHPGHDGAVYYLSFSPEGRTLMSSARDRAPPTRHWRLQSRNSGGTIAGVAHQFLTCRGVQQLDDPISSCKP